MYAESGIYYFDEKKGAAASAAATTSGGQAAGLVVWRTEDAADGERGSRGRRDAAEAGAARRHAFDARVETDAHDRPALS
jgi:hypothetical protein